MLAKMRKRVGQIVAAIAIGSLLQVALWLESQ